MSTSRGHSSGGVMECGESIRIKVKSRRRDADNSSVCSGVSGEGHGKRFRPGPVVVVNEEDAGRRKSRVKNRRKTDCGIAGVVGAGDYLKRMKEAFELVKASSGVVVGFGGPVGGPGSVEAVAPVVPSVPVVRGPAAVVSSSMVPPKPVETWSVVVRGKGGKKSSKEVVRKVREEVAQSLGVRVHEVRATRDGGAVIRTPSVAERNRVRANPKFGEVELQVSVEEKLGPRVVVENVECVITPDEFKAELYALNLRAHMTEEEFAKGVKVVGGGWKPGNGRINVVLECTEEVERILLAGRCYVKWYSFRVRAWDPVPSCFRCHSFDHRVRECRFDKEVCIRCGQVGHLWRSCVNAVNCRNCALRGRPAGHLMLSGACPEYAMMVARANARH